MSFVTAEVSAQVLSGFTPNIILIQGTYTNAGSGTGGVIAPGYANSSGSFTLTSVGNATLGAVTVGGRQILNAQFTPATNDATAPGAPVATYDATLDRYIVTLVTTADSTGTYQLWCLNNGA